MTLHLLVMCSTRGFFTGCISWATRKLVAKSTCSSFDTWFFTNLSHSSLTIKTHIHIGKMIEEITIKFRSELKLTQYSWKSQLYSLYLVLSCLIGRGQSLLFTLKLKEWFMHCGNLIPYWLITRCCWIASLITEIVKLNVNILSSSYYLKYFWWVLLDDNHTSN